MADQHQARDPKDYRVILQHDAPEALVHRFGPVSKEALIAATIGQFEKAPVDVYASDVNHGGGVHFDTKTFERHSVGLTEFSSSSGLQMLTAMQHLLDQGTEPLQIYCEAAHARGIDYMVRVRMNDLHDSIWYSMNMSKPRHRPGQSVPELYYNRSEWRLSHPEYLMGDPTDGAPEDTYEYCERFAPNYALGPVREHMLNMIHELVNNYDLDALELDFIRMPYSFLKHERYAQRHVMTGVIGQVRRFCDEAAEKRGRPIRLSVRVPDTRELCLLSGYDLATWLENGYLDMVSIGGGYCPFGTPWRDIVSLCSAAGVPAFACLNHGPLKKNREMIRAAAMRAYAHGVTGIKLWNFFYCMEHYHPPGQNPLDYSFVSDIASPEALNGLAKTYVPGGEPDIAAYITYDHTVWPRQLPLTIGIAYADVGNTVVFDVGDDLETRSAASARLSLDVVDLGPTDELLFFFNGEPVQADPSAWGGVSSWSRHHFEFVLPCSSIVRGENAVELRLVRRDERLAPFISLWDASLSIPGTGEGQKQSSSQA